jgi:hypothetical protein
LHSEVYDKPVVIVDANAVVDPWAVMIEALNALVAHVAVPAPDRADRLTLRAQLGRIEVLQQLHKWHFAWHISRV